MIEEALPDGHRWLRVCEPSWDDPLDPTFAQRGGGRWNPPDSWPTLYLNEDVATARLNLRAFVAGWPYEPEDLRADTGPQLAVAALPRRQRVADAHSPEGLAALGLPLAYPFDDAGRPVPRTACQPIGERVKAAGLRGLRCRSALAADGAGRELAWFPASSRSRARLVERLDFDHWYWG